jgi:hypothetical protein
MSGCNCEPSIMRGSWPTRDSCAMDRSIVNKSKFVPVHAMTAYRGVEVYLHSFLTLISDEGYWTTLRPGTRVGGLTGCKNLPEFLENRKKYLGSAGIRTRDLAVRSLILYTNYVISGSTYYTGLV